jgi:uncharacterized protein (DUF1330 family)
MALTISQAACAMAVFALPYERLKANDEGCDMKLLNQLDLPAIKAAFRADLPTPVDVLNLIHFKDEDAYKWYGVMAMPLLKATGGRVGWMGAHAQSFVGEPRAEELIVVRYPNQRRFFALALNPYYIALANPQRLKGVRRFEASFTHSPDSLDALRPCKWLLAVHCHGDLDEVRRIVESVGGHRVYQSRETSPISISRRPHPAGTNPLAFKCTALFRFDDQQSCAAAMQPGALAELEEAAGELSIQLYRRLPRKDALPASVAQLLR